MLSRSVANGLLLCALCVSSAVLVHGIAGATIPDIQCYEKIYNGIEGRTAYSYVAVPTAPPDSEYACQGPPAPCAPEFGCRRQGSGPDYEKQIAYWYGDCVASGSGCVHCPPNSEQHVYVVPCALHYTFDNSNCTGLAITSTILYAPAGVKCTM
jgi:hypothetical protein